MSFFESILGYFVSPLGLLLLAALDSSMLFFMPLAVDIVLVMLTARNEAWALGFAALATAGSVVGAAGTFWLGRRAGEHGLERFIDSRKVDHLKSRVRARGAVMLALPALFPPPFPLTPVILASGALDVNRTRFFFSLALFRMVRFGLEAWLAARLGGALLTWMESDAFKAVVGALAVIALAGTIVAIWSSLRRRRQVLQSAPDPAT